MCSKITNETKNTIEEEKEQQEQERFENQEKKIEEKNKQTEIYSHLVQNLRNTQEIFYNKPKILELDLDINRIFKEYFKSGIKNTNLDKDISDFFDNSGKNFKKN